MSIPMTVENARRLADQNYGSWGHIVMEAYTDEELAEELAEHKSMTAWVRTRKSVASVWRDREAMGEW